MADRITSVVDDDRHRFDLCILFPAIYSKMIAQEFLDMATSRLKDKYQSEFSLKQRSDLSFKQLGAFMAFIAGSELFHFYAESSRWLANLVGLGLWCVVECTVPPRPKIWSLLLATALLALIVLALHLLHIG